jgi:secondary thiamine-phosphate synthase enzyme
MIAWRGDLTLTTDGRGTTDLTAELDGLVADSGVDVGQATVFVHHTSASLLVNENADPTVRRDLEAWMARAVPDGDPLFAHDAEGPDDMPAHVRTMLAGSSLVLPVNGGRLDLGTWQGVYLWEHRARPHRRRVSVTVIGA